MTQKLYRSVSSGQKAKDESLFWGIWLRWSALSAAERLICANITLLPVWWAVGLIRYLPLLILASIVLYDWWRDRGLSLKPPSMVVIALFVYSAYNFIDTFLLFFDAYPSLDLPLNFAVKSTDLVKSAFGFSLPCLVWYVQSNNIRVRLEAIVWACSVSIIQMLVFWVLVQFVFPGAFDQSTRSLFAILTGKQDESEDAFLLFYKEGRFRFFFNHNQACAAFLGFTGLLALELKNRFWSLLILVACVFLLSLSATRSVWVAFPIAVFIRFLFTTGKVGGTWFLCTLLAIASFVTLSLPPITNLVFNTYTGTATAVGDARAGSTEIRSRIYTQTLEEIPEKPLFGHKVVDSITRLSGEEGVGAGSHSFILGDLLYKGGLVGFGLFVTYWTSLLLWFYNTRAGRPVSWFPVMLFFSVISGVTTFQWTMDMGILICMALYRPAIKSPRGMLRNA